MPGRHGNTSDYRYGFQGQEIDNEIKGEGNSVNYKYRMHDPRVGRFFSVDPLIWKYPQYSSYSFSGNKVIQFVELEGLEEGFRLPMDGSVELKQLTWQNLKNNLLIKPFVDTHDRARRQAEWYRNNEHILEPNQQISFGAGQIYFATFFREFGPYSDAEDVSVLFEGKTINGEDAGVLDYSLAGAGAFLPFISGGAFKQMFQSGSKRLFESGANIFRATEGKTTTILGRLPDTKSLGQTLDNVRSGANEGGFNILNQPDEYWDINTNMKWLQRAINRGDIIKAASDPTDLKNIYRNGVDGKKSVFGQEVDYLKEQGYEYESSSQSFIKQ